MQIQSSFKLRFLAVFLCLCTSEAAQGDTLIDTDAIATQAAVPTSAGHDIPSGAFGFVLIERPREVELLALRGIGGSGRVILRTGQPGMCLTLAIRFVAGDFGGSAFSGHLSDPIRLIIRSREVARALAHGRDIVSDEYNIGSHLDPQADIVLQSGLEESYGFLINPGRNILGDLFGVRTTRVSCQRV